MEPSITLRKQRTEVYCTVQIEATHNWPDCPFDEVDYLRVPHRHVFHIKAYAPVTHSDRDIEFIMLKHKIRDYLVNKYGNFSDEGGMKTVYYTHCVFGAMSCEMLAEELILKFNLTRCDVSEDNENGAIVEVEQIW